MRLSQLRNLVGIAEAGSLRKAAGALAVSQPALTKSIRQLEEELHAPILERSHRGVVLTDYGRVVVARARTAFIELDRIAEEIESMRGAAGGHVRIAVSPVAAATLVPGALRRFRKDHPDVNVTVADGLYPKVLPLIREREIDFAVGPLPQQMLGPEFEAEQLFFSDVRIACCKHHPLAKATSLFDLRDAQWAMTGPEQGPGGMFERTFLELGVTPPRAVVRFESMMALLATAAVENLLFVMPIKIIEHPFHAPILCAVPIQERISPVRIYLLRSTASPLPPAAEALATAMRRTPAA